jgi:hypothetical protein
MDPFSPSHYYACENAKVAPEILRLLIEQWTLGIQIPNELGMLPLYLACDHRSAPPSILYWCGDSVENANSSWSQGVAVVVEELRVRIRQSFLDFCG